MLRDARKRIRLLEQENEILRPRNQLRFAIVTWIEGNYHRARRQRALGKPTPIAYEAVVKPPAAIAA